MTRLELISRPPCEVCLNDREVVACRPGERVGPIIPCPHCSDSTVLRARVPRAPTPPSGGAA